MRAVLLGLLAVVLLTEDADAAQDLGSLRSANALMPSCQTFLIDGVLKSPAEGFCVGVVVGLGYASNNYKEMGSCRPPGATIAQAVRVVVGYIERHPQRMDEDFSLLAMEALHVTWRCK
jgi:Rap1a immunity proteins